MTDKKTYSLVISSQDKIQGTNNNATYFVNWRDFLPDDDVTNYKVNFSFQSTAGSYVDGITKIPTSTAGGVSRLITNAPSASATGTNSVGVGGTNMNYNTLVGTIYQGQYIVCYNAGMEGYVNCFPTGTVVLANTGSVLSLSNGCVYPITVSSKIYLLNPPNAAPALPVLANPVCFNSARIVLNTNSKSYSFDTVNKAQSTNLGIITRDVQTTQSRTNSLSSKIDNLPRTIVRPSDNMLTVQVFNNAVFAGGITSYSDKTPNTFSIVATNKNYLTDSDTWGTSINPYTNDMSDYNLYLEFTPLD